MLLILLLLLFLFVAAVAAAIAAAGAVATILNDIDTITLFMKLSVRPVLSALRTRIYEKIFINGTSQKTSGISTFSDFERRICYKNHFKIAQISCRSSCVSVKYPG